ncbi:dihydrofolate reductase family protein [Spirosoma aerolatum]|uniref:dihydrofolate reductase family protein n=1 Tax=Spirosoma aerolatum TaxID=1211326 RepID=UPI0009ACEF41|nr:dihydrofolate reductase family protein [Spirosoma aerolatum]
MRKLILFMHVSLDGFVCGRNNEQDWMTLDDHEMGEFMASDFQKTVDTMLVGRVLYEGFASFWPTVPTMPNTPPELVDFAYWMINTPKIVFSKTLQTVEWTNSHLAQHDLAEEVAQLKQKPGGDIIVFGGATLVAALAEQNLIDEYRIKLEPILLGAGKPLFAQIQDRIKLKLTKSRAFSSGVVGLYYEVDRPALDTEVQ